MLFDDLIAWFKNPDPDTVILKFWQRKRTRAKETRRLEAIQQAEEYRQRVEKQAYLLWEAAGKPEGKEEYYWSLAINQIEGNNFPAIYQPYYRVEKRVLEPVDAWIDKQAFFAILGKLGNLAVVVAIITFVFGENIRRNNEVFAAWQTITSAHGQSGSGGRIKALEFLNSRPLRFPWIGWTKDLFWDEREEKCKEKLVFGRRWQREPLVGLSAPNKAYLARINLCDANLVAANLQEASLGGANLQDADLRLANLQDADLLVANLQDADLGRADLQDADLLVANLQDADLMEANLQDALLVKANLQDADLGRADLQDAYLGSANLQEADLEGANLQDAYLVAANLQDAYLVEANLQDAVLERTENLTARQIKLACFWEQAIYKGEWNEEKETQVAIEPDNSNYIEKLKNDKSTDPQEPVDCSRWKKEN